MKLTNGNYILEQFIALELNAGVRSVLNRALDEWTRSNNILVREFEFNCFDITLDFERGMVKLQDTLSSGIESYIELPMAYFISVCGLNMS